MTRKIAAIIGRPNVGKSSLFNRLIGKKQAIVHNISGVTRDRNYGEAEWNGKKFFLIDTGGFVPNSKDTFESAIREQVKISIDEADIILFVVDAKTGLTPLDYEIAKIFRKEIFKKEKNKKKIILVVNKVDSSKDEYYSSEFKRLGFNEIEEVSALVGRNSGNLLDKITDNILSEDTSKPEEDTIKFAIIGRPNVGKSSIANALTQSNRNIVTEIPGTTRDSVDTVIKYHNKNITLIDTAGLRRKSKIRRAESLEYFSAIRTHKSIERCDVSIIVIDATVIMSKLSKFIDPSLASFKLSKEDVEIINHASELKKGILIVINKWDLIKKNSKTSKIFEEKFKEHLKTYNYLPFIFTSALKMQRIPKIIDEALKVYYERDKLVKTNELNSRLNKYIKQFPPRSKTHKEIRINYITQVQKAPPVFSFFTNYPKEIDDNYKRFLENKIRSEFGFTGVPLTLVFKKKN